MLEFLLLSPSLVLSRPEMEEVVRPSMEITVPEAVPRTMVPVDFVSRIPVQVSLENPLYSLFFEKASEFVGVDTSECARFVNRIFGARFGVLPFGDAWTMQTAKENQKFLTLVWRLAENEYDKKTLQLRQKEDRVKHFEELYSVLEREEYPIGVLGFLYHFSPYTEYLVSHPGVLPQSHVAFIAGREKFFIHNDTSVPQTVEQILTEKFGVIHDFERSFVAKKVSLEKSLLPGEGIGYTDFLVEEHFKRPMRGSLLELFLRKHRNNNVTPLLRPVSFSRISHGLIQEIKMQKLLLAELGSIRLIKGSDYGIADFPRKDIWTEMLLKRFDIKDIEKSLLVPIPQ